MSSESLPQFWRNLQEREAALVLRERLVASCSWTARLFSPWTELAGTEAALVTFLVHGPGAALDREALGRVFKAALAARRREEG